MSVLFPGKPEPPSTDWSQWSHWIASMDPGSPSEHGGCYHCSLDSEPTAPNASRWYPWTVHQKVRLYATFERSPKPFWKVPQFLIKQETSCPVHPLGLTTSLVFFFLKSWIIFTFNHLCHFTCVVFGDCKTPSGKYIWYPYDGGTKAINPHLQKSKSHGLWSWVQNMCPLL